MLDTMLFLPNMGAPEVVVILLLVLIFFGGKKIPELARGLGKGIREFNSAKASIEGEIKEGMKTPEKQKEEVKLEK